jgi:hypothetical protein
MPTDDISIIYEDSEIASASQSGLLTLLTRGKYCRDNFRIRYNKSGAGNIKEIVIRPDAELMESYSYDRYIVQDEGVTIPAYSTAQQTLKASSILDEITAEPESYRYFIGGRTLAIPEYNTNNVGRGRFEWSSMVSSYEFFFTSMDDLKPLVPGVYRIATNSGGTQGAVSYRGLYFTSTEGLSVYASSTYGIWASNNAPTYVSGKIRIPSPIFTMRGQPNIFDQPFWDALTDIRFQYVFDLWRVPLESLGYNGWQSQQSIDLTLECLYSPTHKLV